MAATYPSGRDASGAGRRGARSRFAVLAAVCALAGCAIPGPETSTVRSAPTVAPPVAAPVTTAPRTGPLTPDDPDRISADARAAIERLGASGASEPPAGGAHGHSSFDRVIEVPLLTGDAATFADQWRRARAAAPAFDSLEELRALGFVRASTPGPGVGTHWVNWSWVAAPFDPARPSMVLVDEQAEPARLVAFVYWLQAASEPVGFAGTNDHWHRHTGLCVVNGWVDREDAGSAAACAGTYLAGGDLWMLHAWAVPGFENRLGRFANVHPALCPTATGTPDIARCPED